MKIVISPETEAEKKRLKEAVFSNVCEFALIGTLIDGVLPRNFWSWDGDRFVLLGRVSELHERLHASTSKR